MMTPGAAYMALFTDRVKPNLVPALTRPNPTKGWDFTIELPKSDSAFQSLAKAKMVILMTTGWTGAAVVGPADHAVLADFASRCATS